MFFCRFFKNRNWLFTEFPELALTLEENLPPVKTPPEEISLKKDPHTQTANSISKDETEQVNESSNNTSCETATVSSSNTSQGIDNSAVCSTSANDGCSSDIESHKDKKIGTDLNQYLGADAKFCMLELGCGVGNTIFPVLETNSQPELFVYGADFSSTAIDIVRQHENYDQKRYVQMLRVFTRIGIILFILLPNYFHRNMYCM